MIGRVNSLALGVFVAFLAPALSWAATEEDCTVYDIPRLPPIVVDGDASDWGDAGFLVKAMVTNHDGGIPAPADFSPRFRLGWNDDGLLVLLEVRDDEAKEHNDFFAIASHDSVRLEFVTHGKEKQTHASLMATPNLDPKYPDPFIIYIVDDQIVPRGAFTAPAVQKTSNGYRMEILMPWKSLGVTPILGQEMEIKVGVSDADGSDAPDKPAPTMADWVFRSQEIHAPSSGQRIRLAEKPSPPITASASGSRVEGLMPWISVVATLEHVGHEVVVTRNDRRITRGKITESGGEGRLRLLLPSLQGNEPYGELAVLLEGEPIGIVSFASRFHTGALSVYSSQTQETGAGVRVRVGLKHSDITYPETKCTVDVLHPDGTTAAHSDCSVGEGVEFDLKPGLYRIKAGAADFHGYTLEGETAFIAGGEPRTTIQATVARAQKAMTDPRREVYAGWFAYLAFKIETLLEEGSSMAGTQGDESKGSVSPDLLNLTLELASWLERSDEESNPLSGLRGLHEWAYLSKVDQSGQPFAIYIPESYNPSRPEPLEVYLHGNGATHVRSYVIKAGLRLPPGIQARVLGRGTGLGYQGLSEVDVLEAIDYVRKHWTIDPDGIRIFGESMGGGGTFHIAGRHPDLFASARPLCMGSIDLFPGNFRHVPLLAFHSMDDGMVPIALTWAATGALDKAGSQVVLLETDGFNHAVWEDRDGFYVSQSWAHRQMRTKDMSRVDYTATDELARGAYWVEVVAWGPEGRPASIDARVGTGNTLYLSLDNVKTARICLGDSPADCTKAMTIVIDRVIVTNLDPPLPENVYVTDTEGKWDVQSRAPDAPHERLHFPGGANALYHGEPILVVWGTHGTEGANRNMYSVAQVARRSANPSWPTYDEINPEGVPNRYMMYARLPGKADDEVTDADMAKYNLLLIGTANQNSVVARLAQRLPVKMESGHITADDGSTWDATGRAIGLLYYNPLEPRRLIYWVGSESAHFYKPGARFMARQAGSAASPDLLIMDAVAGTFVAARRFDSRWRWQEDCTDSPLLDKAYCGQASSADFFAHAIRMETGSDFVLTWHDDQSTHSAFSYGETRIMDLLNDEFHTPLAIMDLTGQELLEDYQRLEQRRKAEELSEKDQRQAFPRFLPAPESQDIDLTRTYRVAMPAHVIWGYYSAVRRNHRSFRLTEHTLREALKHYALTASRDGKGGL